MKRFIKNLALFLFLPFVIFVIVFFIYLSYDPFQVVHKYDAYFESSQKRPVTTNYDYVSIETFLNHYPTYQYNSFILGNSRSRFYKMEQWSKYIHSERGIHLDASGETLYGIWEKMKFLDEKKVNIDNALIVLDYSTLGSVTNSKGHLFIKHPLLSGQSKFDFQLEFFKAFCSPKFLLAYLEYRKTNTITKGGVLDDINYNYIPKYNEMSFNDFEGLIRQDSSKFYDAKKMEVFYKRDGLVKYSPEVIQEEQLLMLNDIKRILAKQGTNYRIIINPLYDQLKLNGADLNTLKAIFGPTKVFDFSGINALTSDFHNYYEESHYRPHVADYILNIAYQKNSARLISVIKQKKH